MYVCTQVHMSELFIAEPGSPAGFTCQVYPLGSHEGFACQVHPLRFLCGHKEIVLQPQRSLSVAEEKSPCGHRQNSVATKKSVGGYKEIFLWTQRNISVATKRSLCGCKTILCGHRDISLWPLQGHNKISVATEKARCGHKEISLCSLCGHRKLSL